MISVALVVVTLVVAVRSTWSPCGWSMLSTLTPMSERARGHKYLVTLSWYVLGSTVGGLIMGSMVGLLGLVVEQISFSHSQAVGISGLACVVCVLSDWPGVSFKLPTHTRQVNEDWIDHYRVFVYAGGFGLQIGSGYATYITTAGVYLTGVLAVLSGSALRAIVMGIGFGMVRGISILLAGRLESPGELVSFHRFFDQAGSVAQVITQTAMAIVAVVLLGTLWVPLGVVTALAMALVALREVTRGQRVHERTL